MWKKSKENRSKEYRNSATKVISRQMRDQVRLRPGKSLVNGANHCKRCNIAPEMVQNIAEGAKYHKRSCQRDVKRVQSCTKILLVCIGDQTRWRHMHYDKGYSLVTGGFSQGCFYGSNGRSPDHSSRLDFNKN